MRWFGRKKKESEEVDITCPRCGSGDVGLLLNMDNIESVGGGRLPREPGIPCWQCQQCGLTFQVVDKRWDKFWVKKT